MAPKIFITGVTGYIAGDALYALNKAHPEYEYAALVRTKDKAEKVKAAYPNIRIVLGGLDDAEILKEEAAAADIVLHAADASDHAPAAKSIAEGLLSSHSPSKPAYWLHTGGTGILTYFDSAANKLGERSDKQFNDWTSVGELTTLPAEAFHRNVDQIVLATDPDGAKGVHTAIICPPTIYGAGRGPVSGRGRQVYELASLILRNKYAPIIGAGHARWNNVHVEDLSQIFVALVELATGAKKVANGFDANDAWGERGYYFTENGEHEWGTLSRDIAKTAANLSFIPRDFKENALSKDEALEVAGFEALSWGLNSRGKAERAKNVLDWHPQACSLEGELGRILESEQKRL